jgi:hypothetical protein
VTHPGGRPSKYDPAYCEQVVTFCAAGYSITGFAGSIGVDRDTISEWGKVHPEFSVALRRAKAAAIYGLETDANGIRKKGGGPGAATMCIFGLKNFAPEEYADRIETKHTGDANNPVVVQDVSARELIASRVSGLAARVRSGADSGSDGSAS